VTERTLQVVIFRVSTEFSVTGDVAHAQTFDLASLQALPSVQRSVGTSTYTGVSFWDLLNDVGISTDANVKNGVLRKYVVATGSDGHRAAFSLGALDPAFGNEPDIVAYAVIGALLTGSGFARVVAPDDVKAGRFVSNLVSLEVQSAPQFPSPTPGCCRRASGDSGKAMPGRLTAAVEAVPSDRRSFHGIGGRPPLVPGLRPSPRRPFQNMRWDISTIMEEQCRTRYERSEWHELLAEVGQWKM
jgi:hypothetical protein